MSVINVHAQLLNNDFETWTGVAGGYSPTHWLLYANDLPHSGPMDGWRSLDAHTGNYALQLNVWYFYTDTRAVQKAPVTYRPVSLSGWYKYTDNIIKNQTTNLITDDTANATVYLTKWNTTTSSADTIGYGKIELLGSNRYLQFNCPINYSSSATPDTVVVILDPSLMRNNLHNYFSEAGYSSYLKIDDLSLLNSASANNLSDEKQIILWPNPANNYLDVYLPWLIPTQAALIDISGRVVYQTLLSNPYNRIQLEGLIAGTYILQITTPNTGHTYKYLITHH